MTDGRTTAQWVRDVWADVGWVASQAEAYGIPAEYHQSLRDAKKLLGKLETMLSEFEKED